jgi:hypothetical protein
MLGILTLVGITATAMTAPRVEVVLFAESLCNDTAKLVTDLHAQLHLYPALANIVSMRPNLYAWPDKNTPKGFRDEDSVAAAVGDAVVVCVWNQLKKRPTNTHADQLLWFDFMACAFGKACPESSVDCTGNKHPDAAFSAFRTCGAVLLSSEDWDDVLSCAGPLDLTTAIAPTGAALLMVQILEQQQYNLTAIPSVLLPKNSRVCAWPRCDVGDAIEAICAAYTGVPLPDGCPKPTDF